MASTLLALSLVILNVLGSPQLDIGSPTNVGASLLSAAGSGDLQELKRLLNRGADIKAQDYKEWTPLHEAAYWNHLNVVKELLDRGANIDAQSNHGFTALHMAANRNHLNVVKELLDRGADIDAQDKDGETALHWAARNSQLDVVKELVDRGANALTKSPDGRTAMEVARKYGHTEMERVLKMAEDQQRLSGSKAGISYSTAPNTTLLFTLCAATIIKIMM